MPPFDKEEFAKALRAVMSATRIKAGDLAQKVGVDRATVSQWRAGAYLPKADKRAELAGALDVTEAVLFGGDDPRTLEQQVNRVWMLEFELRLHKEFAATAEEVTAALALVQSAAGAAERFMATGGGVGVGGREFIGLELLASAVRRELKRRRSAEAEPLIPVRDRLQPVGETDDARKDTLHREGSG